MDNFNAEKILSLSNISRECWNEAFKLCVHLNYENLRVVEESKINNISTIYLRFFSKEEIGRSNLYIVNSDFSTMDANQKDIVRIIKGWYPEFMKFKTLECGSFTGISEGTAVKNEKDYPEVLHRLASEMDKIAREQDVDIQMVRDIPLHRYQVYKDVFSRFGYYPTPGFSDTAIEIRWDSLDCYFSDLKKKKRDLLKNYLKNLKNKYDIDHEFTNDYEHLVPVMTQLWKNIHDSAHDYQREFLDENYFLLSSRYLKNNSEVLLFRKQDRIISFMLCMFDQDAYYALNYGADYSMPDYMDMNLYRVSVLLRIQRAIDLNKKYFSLGITNYDIKLEMGAAAVPLVYFIKHTKNKSYSTALAKLLYDKIKHPDTQMHKPFANYDPNTFDYPLYLLKIKADQNDLPDDDIFLKVSKYHRTDIAKLTNLYNFYPEFKSAQESSIRMENIERVVLLGTNSYLGAATFPEVREAAIKAIERYGTGCSGSPLLNGTLDLHKQLEEELAKFYNREAVMLCSTGYQTNLAGISALAEPGDVLIMDERDHRSLFDAAKLSGAHYYMYRHNDVGHLESILSRLGQKRKLIVSDSVFSMEGIIANLTAICDLGKKYNARIFIDEAHGVGVFGENGRGVCELLGVEGNVDLIMGTFSKSFASIGGFLAGKKELIDFIRHTGSPHIFSASLPPSAIAAVLAVLRIIKARPELRKGILVKARYMADALQHMGYNTSFKGTQIVPVVFGNETLAMAAYKRFMESGVYVNPVLPPAVPENNAGFRTSYIATHKDEDLEFALTVFKKHREDFIRKGETNHHG